MLSPSPDTNAQPAARRRWGLALLMPAVALLVFVLAPVLRFAGPAGGACCGEAGHLAARLEMARAGGIGLVVDLAGGVAELQVDGVPVRQSPILGFDVGRGVRGDSVLTMRGARATIAKEPVHVVRAPRDTVEAQARPPQQRPDEGGAVHFTLDASPALLVHVRDAEGGWLGRAWFDAGQRLAAAERAIEALVTGRLPAHTPAVSLMLSRADARAVYRALPEDARLLVRLPAASGAVAVQVPDAP